MSLLEAEVPIENVITTDLEKAKALDNDVRAKILDMLADEALTVDDIRTELSNRGEEKAETTVRHHVDLLKDAGLIELARLDEEGGATTKYYKANTRIFPYELPDSAETALADAIDTTRSELSELVQTLIAEHGEAIRTVAEDIKPCEHCETQHFEEYILYELLNQTLTEMSEAGDLDELLH